MNALSGRSSRASSLLQVWGSDSFELGVTHHQPLAALGEVHLHPRLGACAFEVEDHAFAEGSKWLMMGYAKLEAV